MASLKTNWGCPLSLPSSFPTQAFKYSNRHANEFFRGKQGRRFHFLEVLVIQTDYCKNASSRKRGMPGRNEGLRGLSLTINFCSFVGQTKKNRTKRLTRRTKS